MIKSRLQSPQASQSMAINVRERMAHNFKNGAAPDRSRVSMDDQHEVRSWTEMLGCSKDELAAAVARVGNSSDAVRREVFRAWAYGTFRLGAPERRRRGRPRKASVNY
jgi:hypothetical protein